jgi:hypothetical protein
MTTDTTDRSHDANRIIDLVRDAVPEVTVVQMYKVYPADDDGLWWFRLPGIDEDIQIESSTYNCPFIIEHSGMHSSSEALKGESIDQVADEVISYLRSLASADKTKLP